MRSMPNIFKDDDEFFRFHCHAREGYTGWIDAQALQLKLFCM